MWGAFSHYHYLTESIPSSGKVYVGFINNEPVGVVVTTHFPHPTNKNIEKISRVVTLPHWQGYGIGMKMMEKICEVALSDKDIRITTTLPIVHSYLFKSPKWLLKFQGVRKGEDAGKNAGMSGGVREVYMETYQYVNDHVKNVKISRTRCPKDKKKEYSKERVKEFEAHLASLEN